MFLENSLDWSKRKGWIEVICGSMFSGKTEELIRRLKRAKIGNRRICYQGTCDLYELRRFSPCFAQDCGKR